MLSSDVGEVTHLRFCDEERKIPHSTEPWEGDKSPRQFEDVPAPRVCDRCRHLTKALGPVVQCLSCDTIWVW